MKKIEHSIKRQQQLEDGAFDGRYRTKIVVDKKKKLARNWARQKGTQAN